MHPGAGASLTGKHHFERFNPSLGITFQPNEILSTYASYSESSRAPTSIELGCANPAQPCNLPTQMADDPPLNQVVAKTFEGGISGRMSADTELEYVYLPCYKLMTIFYLYLLMHQMDGFFHKRRRNNSKRFGCRSFYKI